MPSKIFFFRHIPILLTSRDMLLPKKGLQVTCGMMVVLGCICSLLKRCPRSTQ